MLMKIKYNQFIKMQVLTYDMRTQIANTSNIKLASGSQKKEVFYLPFIKDLLFQISVTTQKKKPYIFRATLCYKNLLSVQIPILYFSTLGEMIKNSARSMTSITLTKCYGIKFPEGELFFQSKLNYFDREQKIFQSYFTQMISDFASTWGHLSICLENIGIIKTDRPITLFLTKSERQLKEKIMSILSYSQIQEQTEKQCSQSTKMNVETQKHNWKLVDKIQQLDTSSQEIYQKFKGGYCQIERKVCKVYQRGDGQMQRQPQMKILAVKTLNQNRKDTDFDYIQKLQNQKRILQHIGQSKYLLNYYEQKNKPDVVYMDYSKNTLSDFINKDQYKIQQVISISIEVVKAAISLQQMGIIHRDLKPSNILLQKDNDVKIIDFGQSTLVSDKFVQNQKLGATIPYSAIQCVSDTPAGFNNKALDNWSVGVILYEIMFKKLPVSYTRCFNKDILKGWETELMIPLNKLKKNGLRVIEDIFNIITIKLVKFKQQSRLSLKKVLQILQLSQDYLTHIKNFGSF